MDKDNTIAAREEKMSALVNPEYTGNTITGSSKFPPVINILQSDKQYEAFGEEGDDITKKLYGKLFVRRQEGNSLEDLQDSISGIVLKIEQGHEVREFDETVGRDKIIDSKPYMITKSSKEQWVADNPGKTFKNMVKVVLSPTTDISAVRAHLDAGDNPFCMLTIKGSAWGSWFEAQKAMDQVAMASKVYGHKRSQELAVSCFKFNITSKMETSSDGSFDYYTPVIDVELNDPDTAFDFTQITNEMKDLSLFYKVAEQIEEREESTTDNTSLVEDVIGGDEFSILN